MDDAGALDGPSKIAQAMCRTESWQSYFKYGYGRLGDASSALGNSSFDTHDVSRDEQFDFGYFSSHLRMHPSSGA